MDPSEERAALRDLLDRSVIAKPLLDRIKQGGDEAETERRTPIPVVIDLNFQYPDGPAGAADRVRQLVADALEGHEGTRDQRVVEERTNHGGQYVVARLDPEVIQRVVALDQQAAGKDVARRAIFRIWPDFKVRPHILKSGATVKVDAARTTFQALGEGIVWAVLDSGIDGNHPHFSLHKNLRLGKPLEHMDFTGKDSPLTDEFGHGTHVAGILAGRAKSTSKRRLTGARRSRDEAGDLSYDPIPITEISGMAPRCTLVSYKVLDENGDGETSTLIAALQEVSRINDNGRDLKIHGVNLSLGYPFNPEWFACGRSPVCNEVNHLVSTGVVVVVSAGNTGYGWNQDWDGDSSHAAGMDLTINDPGNADGAITVGSTHRDAPHYYGVSFFSSKGPTGDGRAKPDLVAPGERILAPAAGRLRADAPDGATWDYLEDTGTSMAAPHVSGAVAAFLSVRREFIGEPPRLKEIFTESAVDLRRVPEFQGHGLLDLHRAISSV